MKPKLLLLCCFAVTALLAKANNCPLKDPGKCKKNDINGGVYNSETKKPIGNVSITAYFMTHKEKISLTDESGNYAFYDLKPGLYKLVFEKEGYKKITKEKIQIKTCECYQMNIEMIEEKDFIFIPAAFSF